MNHRLYSTLREERELRKFEKEHGRQDSIQWRPLRPTKQDETYREYRLALEKYLLGVVQ